MLAPENLKTFKKEKASGKIAREPSIRVHLFNLFLGKNRISGYFLTERLKFLTGSNLISVLYRWPAPVF
jgi:hypothetical protein